MHKRITTLLAVAALTLCLSGATIAQTTPPPGAMTMPPPGAMTMPPPGAMTMATRDPSAAPEGTYRIDPDHQSVVARVSHRAMSFSVVRFGVRQGVLHWNPANPSAITLDVTVDAKPFFAPIVYKMPPDGAPFLNVAKFPEARFVSTAVHVKDGARAAIDGQLTLMGVTRPVVIDAELVGAGRSMNGTANIGFTGTMAVNWAEFSDQPMARMAGKVTLMLDAEFLKD
ncbi:YceI family protein [Novosphingobium sp.]|uniref:YceI family protein n=1 Tax=Novosphingobium sp. TaxID=1874826 RepID=UPI00334153B8